MNPRSARVLVAEDDESHRYLIAHLLERTGHNVSLAVDGCDALHQMFQRVFDVVITDWEMPGLKGSDFLRLSHILWPNTPVIIVSARTIASPRDIPEGALAWIRKPYRTQELLQVLHEAVQTSLHLREAQTSITPS
ncbi:response regulator [Petrachloros mirabilis]